MEVTLKILPVKAEVICLYILCVRCYENRDKIVDQNCNVGGLQPKLKPLIDIMLTSPMALYFDWPKNPSYLFLYAMGWRQLNLDPNVQF